MVVGPSKASSKQDAAVGDEAKDAGVQKGIRNQRTSRDRHEGITAIDGKVDEVWEKADSVSVHRLVEDLTTLSKDQMVRPVKFLWDKQHLYALWVVKVRIYRSITMMIGSKIR